MRMVIINNRPWALGFHWVPPRLKRLSREKLMEAAGKIDPRFDLFAMRKQQAAFGIASGPVEDWRKTRSLAAILPNLKSFLGLFCLEDVNGERCWWVFARQNGINVGMGDRAFSEFEAANNEVNIIRDFFKGNFVETLVCESPEESLAWLSSRCVIPVWEHVRGDTLLKAIKPELRQTRFIGIASACAVALLVFWGARTYLEYHENQQAEEAARLRAAQSSLRRQQIQARPEEHFKQEWQSVPLASEQGQACIKATLALPTILNGWSLQSATCSGRSLSVSWEHTEFSDFMELPAQARLQSPKVAVVRSSLPVAMSARQRQPYQQLPTQEGVKRFLYQVCQNTNTKQNVIFEPPEKKPVEKVEVVAPWVKGRWELAGLHSLTLMEMDVPSVLAQLPGLTLDSVLWQRDSWTFKGRVHAVAP